MASGLVCRLWPIIHAWIIQQIRPSVYALARVCSGIYFGRWVSDGIARSTWLCLPVPPKNIQITFLCTQNVIYFKTRLSLFPHRLNEMHNVEPHKKTFYRWNIFFSIRAIILSNTAERYNRQIWSFFSSEANLFSLRRISDEKSTILHDKFSPADVILIGKLNLKNSRTTFCVLVYSTVFCIVSQPFTQKLFPKYVGNFRESRCCRDKGKGIAFLRIANEDIVKPLKHYLEQLV